MIKNEDGEKCSPKDLANEILIKCLERTQFWSEGNAERIEAMTERELNMLNDQLVKQAKRCFKILGVKIGASGWRKRLGEISMPVESGDETPIYEDATASTTAAATEECDSDGHNVEVYCPDCGATPPPVTCFACEESLVEPVQCDECADLFA